MKPAPFRYARPATLAEAFALLAEPGARLLAGGQSLVPQLNRRLAAPSLLVDLALLPELQVLRHDGDELVVGACVRQRAAETSALVREACPSIPTALRYVGHLATRTRGTVGGSLAYADPVAELPTVAVAAGASVVVAGPGERRRIPVDELFVGPYTTSLARDEIILEARFPIVAGARHAFCEIARAPGGLTKTAVAAVVTPRGTRLVVGGLGGPPLRLRTAEQADRADAEAAVLHDTAALAPARRRVVAALVTRALAEAAA